MNAIGVIAPYKYEGMWVFDDPVVANVNLAKDLTALAKDGRVVVVGNRGKIEINPRDAMQRDAQASGLPPIRRRSALLVTLRICSGWVPQVGLWDGGCGWGFGDDGWAAG